MLRVYSETTRPATTASILRGVAALMHNL
jgi:hypothetical protein